MNQSQVEQYNNEGYTIVKNVFDMNELQPILNEFDDIVDEFATKAFEAGKIKKILLKKLKGYMYQDKKKCVFSPKKFITFDKMIERLVESQLRCFYCNCDLTMVYDDCRQNNQWTLDRINNYDEHSNYVIFNSLGVPVKKGIFDGEVSIFNLTEGYYVIQILNSSKYYRLPFLKVKE